MHARTNDDDFDYGVVVRREVHTPEGKLTFFSRARHAGEQYRDKAGRLIRRVDGICVADDPEGKFVFHPRYLEDAEKINDPYFDRFWPKTDKGEGPEPITEEIAFAADLSERLEGLVVRKPHGTPKKISYRKPPEQIQERGRTLPEAANQESAFPRKRMPHPMGRTEPREPAQPKTPRPRGMPDQEEETLLGQTAEDIGEWMAQGVKRFIKSTQNERKRLPPSNPLPPSDSES